MITGRLSAPKWERPACAAEALALHLVIKRAEDLLIDHDCLDGQQARNLYAGFEDAAFDDADFEWLYLEGLGESASAAIPIREVDAGLHAWFEPTSQPVHFFTMDDDVNDEGE